MNGHSDVVMGAVALNDDDLHSRIRFLQNAIGPVPSPFDCYMVNRLVGTSIVNIYRFNPVPEALDHGY